MLSKLTEEESADIESAALALRASKLQMRALMKAADAKNAEISDLHAKLLIERSDLCGARSEIERLNCDVEEAKAQQLLSSRRNQSVGEANPMKDDRDAEAMKLCRKKDEQISCLEGELRSAKSCREALSVLPSRP